LINEYYYDRVIALDYPKDMKMGMDWPPYSPDLNPCDFFLWGYLKDRVYTETFTDMDELKKKITAEINSIPQSMFRRVAGNFEHRCRVVAEREGHHCEHILKSHS